MLGGLFAKPALKNFPRQGLELKFDLPPFRQNNQRLPGSAEQFEHFEALRGEPLHLLVEVSRFVHQLNLTYISVAKRFAIAERCLRYATPALRTVFAEHHMDKALPESRQRGEALSAAVYCAKELATSFKRVFKNDVALNTWQFRQARRRVRSCAFYILAMIQAELRLKALRYQTLSGKTWRDCNSVFFVMLGLKETSRKHKNLPCLHVSRAPAEQQAAAQKTSLEQLYVATQLLGYFDPNCLSLSQLAVVESYIRQHLEQLATGSAEDDLLPGHIVLYSDLNVPAQQQKTDQFEGDSRTIDISALRTTLEKDKARLQAQLHGDSKKETREEEGRSAGKSGKSAANPVSTMDDLERMLAVDHMLKKLRGVQRTQTRSYIDVEDELFVFNGFTPSFNLLTANQSAEEDGADLNTNLNRQLAQRSAVLAESGTADATTRWTVVNESSGGMLIRTRETQFIKNLSIGQLSVFAKNKSGLEYPSLGYVTRIRRLKGMLLEVSLKRLSRQVEGVAVQNEFLQKNNMAMPGILVIDAGEFLQLIVHQSHRLRPGGAVKIQRAGVKYDYVLGPVQVLQREFLLYNVISPSLEKDVA
jgi:hypothetical protein